MEGVQWFAIFASFTGIIKFLVVLFCFLCFGSMSTSDICCFVTLFGKKTVFILGCFQIMSYRLSTFKLMITVLTASKSAIFPKGSAIVGNSCGGTQEERGFPL